MKRTIYGVALVFFLSLFMFASIPQAQATSLEKFPTATSVIVAGWEDVTNVYALDGNVAFNPSVDDAEQEYSDFGFSLNATDTIDKVYLKISGDAIAAADNVGTETVYQYGEVWDGSAWTSYQVTGIVAISGGGYCEAASSFPVVSGSILVDVSDKIDTPTKVNNIKIRLLTNEFLFSVAFLVNVDAVSVEVCYTPATTTTVAFDAKSALVGFLLLGLPLFTIALAKRKQDLDRQRQET